jgi:anti-anti-sigma factor
METNLIKEGQDTVMNISGRIDAMTSSKLQEDIMNALKTEKNLILDFADVVYVSSAGLRSLLLGHKTAASKGGEMALRNVNKVVMDVLTTVGFGKILSFV